MIKTIDKYIFKQLLMSLLLMSLVLCGAILLSQSLQFLDMTVNEGASFWTFISLIFFSLPKFFVVILPISLVIVTMFVYSKLMGDNEIIIMKSSGMSNFVLARPALVLSAILAIFVFVLDGWVSPMSKGKIDLIKMDIVENQTAVLLQDKVFNDLGDGLSIYVDEKLENGRLKGVFIKDARDKDSPYVMSASSGAIVNTDKAISLTLMNGINQFFDKEEGKINSLEFQQYTVDIKEKKENQNKVFKFIQKDTDERCMIELFKSLFTAKDSREKTAITGVINYKISTPFLIISFITISISFILGGAFRRTGYAKRMSVCFLVIILLQSGAIVLSNLARVNIWYNFIMYIWAIIPGLIGLYFIVRKKAK